MKNDEPNSASETVLVARFTELGNVAMTIPALYDACMANPRKVVVMLTLKPAVALFINRPANLVVEGIGMEVYNSVQGIWSCFVELNNRYHFSTYVDLQNSRGTRVMRMAAHMHRVKVVHVDKGLHEKKQLTRRTGKIMLPLTHTIERYRLTLEAASLPTGERVFRSLFDRLAVDTSAYAGITGPKKGGEVWIGIAPFAKHEGKIYPMHLMEQVVRDLSGRHDTKIFLFGGGPYEQKILSEWARKYPATLAGRA